MPSSNSRHHCAHVCLQDVSGMSLSMLAAAGGQDDILRLLIKKGARVNGRQKNGTTALMHAAEKVTSIPNAKLKQSSHVNARDKLRPG